MSQTACTMNERHVYSRDQLLTGRRTLCRPTLPSDVKYKSVCWVYEDEDVFEALVLVAK